MLFLCPPYKMEHFVCVPAEPVFGCKITVLGEKRSVCRPCYDKFDKFNMAAKQNLLKRLILQNMQKDQIQRFKQGQNNGSINLPES